MVWLLGPASFAGYADATEGLPTYDERETFLWTNAVRIDPAAFSNDYPCSFSSFSTSERTSQRPLLFEPGLAEAASYHSHDMEDENYFDHDSIDGTAWDDRIGRYYSGFTIGENIAYGYGSPYEAVIEGWMCSDGHRSNIMSPDFDEMGTGVAGTYYTQDFGGSNPPVRGMAMGLHRPEEPGTSVDFVVDWNAPNAPDEIYVVVGGDSGEGDRADLSRTFGTDERGLYSVTLTPGGGCQSYYFVATLGAASETWPGDGSYGFGSCSWDDPGARWLDFQLPLDGASDPQGDDDDDDDDDVTGDDDDDDDDVTGDDTGTGDADDNPFDEDKLSIPISGGCGCDTAASSSSLGVLGVTLLFSRSRRAKRLTGLRGQPLPPGP